MIFIVTIFVLFIALVVSSKIPHRAIEENLKESAEFYQKKAGIYRIKNKRVYSYIHYYADTRKLNIIYCLDSDNPIESVLWANYYQRISMDTNRDFIELVEDSKEPNTQYLRYWNGCMLILRPLLTILNMEQIYLINKVLLAILTMVLLMMLFRKSKKLAVVFLMALILTASWYVTYCIEYSVMFYVMIITSIIAIKIDSNVKGKPKEKVEDSLFKLFLITGIVTTFFDFLTTEILTIFVPLLFILIIRKEENRLNSFKEFLKFTLKACILWLVGYVGMWLTKWILVSWLLHINAFDYVKDDILLRINGLQGIRTKEELYHGAINRNIFAIPILYITQIKFYKWQVKLTVIVIVILLLLLTNWKELKKKKYLALFVLIGVMPYVRYLVLANHSYRHVMFTFRDQIITIMVILYIIIDCFNYKILFEDVSIRKLWKKDKKH